MATKKKMLQAAAGVSTGPEGAWDLSYAYFDPPESFRWNISTVTYKTQFNFAAKETSPFDIFISPDGVNMYTIGYNGVHQYSLSTAWLVTGASFVRTFPYSSIGDAYPEGLFFKSDGTKMYVIGEQYKAVREFNLSTAWDISTASYLQNFSVNSQDASPRGVFFKPDGTKMYVTGPTTRKIHEYNLSTAWSVSTASFVQSFSVSAQESSPHAGVLKPDGTKLYVLGQAGRDVNEYDLSTAWDISTASFLQNYIGPSKDTMPTGLFFKPDGLSMYISGDTNNAVWQYNLGGFSVAAQEASPTGVEFKPDGSKMYIVGRSGDDVNEYDLGTYFDLSTAVFLQNFSVAAQEINPYNVRFKFDGTKMYVLGASSAGVLEYNLSTAWDISSASYLQEFAYEALDANARGLFFKPDGTKMYIVGFSYDRISEYNLSSAWDVSSASYLQSFLTTSEEATPTDVFFKTDGTKMYVLGSSGDEVNEYDLSTAWDVTSASFVQNFSVSSQMNVPDGLYFQEDGTKFFVVTSSGDLVFTYSLGVQE